MRYRAADAFLSSQYSLLYTSLKSFVVVMFQDGVGYVGEEGEREEGKAWDAALAKASKTRLL